MTLSSTATTRALAVAGLLAADRLDDGLRQQRRRRRDRGLAARHAGAVRAAAARCASR